LQVYIDLHALIHNARYILSKTDDKQVAAVVKGDAYGHSISLVVPTLVSLGITRFVVSNLKEAYAVWNLGAQWILVLHPSLDDIKELEYLPAPLNSAIRIAVWDFSILDIVPHHVPVHIALSTGFGLGLEEIPDKFSNIYVEGIMGHMPFLDDTYDHQILREKIYQSFVDSAKYYAEKHHIPEIHLCNSATLFYLSGCKDTTMVRTGVGIYGYIEASNIRPELKPVMYQVGEIISIKDVKKGDTVFYGNVAENNMKIAFVRAGYGDGYAGGHYAYHIGSKQYISRVFDLTMNVTAFDVSGVSAKVGEKLLLLGNKARIRADEVGKQTGISTEKVLTKAGLSRRIVLPEDIKDLLQS